MIYRMIIYRYKDGTTDEQIDELHKLIDNLNQALGDDVQVLYGWDQQAHNEDPRHEGYLVIARDQAALDRYQPHPFHEEMLARLDWLEEMSAAQIHKE